MRMSTPTESRADRVEMERTPPSLLEKLQGPDPRPEDWKRFVTLFTPFLKGWARKAGFREDDADDIVQEVLLKLIDGVRAYVQRPGQPFRSWLRQLAIN